MSSQIDEEVLLGCLSEALEQRDEGKDPDLGAICHGREDLMRAVAKAMGRTADLPPSGHEIQHEDSFTGQLLQNRYRLDERLGSGAMGVVYRAQDIGLQRPVAVKILHTVLFDASEAEGRFLREAEAVAAVRHPAVVSVYDRGCADSGQPYLIMELLDGVTLDQILLRAKDRHESGLPLDTLWLARDVGISPREENKLQRVLIRWVAELAAGLAAAHMAGVIHRDIKPSNVFVRSDGRVVLIDFGIAARADHPTLREGQGILGTPAYMAPEALDSKLPAAPQLDTYGLAATLYHMLTLQAPYAGTPSQVLLSLTRKEPVPAQHLIPKLPRDLRAILDHGLQRNGSQRYSTALHMEADLRAYLAHQPVRARPTSSLERWGRRLVRSSAFRAAVGVLILAGALLGAQAWIQSRTAEREAASAQTWRGIPPALTLSKYGDRRLNQDDLTHVQALLDECISLSSSALPARLYRASIRLDHGQPEGASQDFEAIASDLKTPYVQALAGAYRALAPSAEGARDLDISGLPEPVTPEERLLAAYHLLRVRTTRQEVEQARDLLSGTGLQDVVAAQEILLPLRVGLVPRSDSRQRRMAAHRKIYADALRFEAVSGRRSATTAHVIGAALIGQERYQEAFEALHDGIALAPRYHGLRSNLAIAARRVGNLDEARTQLQAALAIQPKALDAHETLLHVEIEAHDFQAARRVLAAMPPSQKPAVLSQRLFWQADILFEEACSGGFDSSAAHEQTALAHSMYIESGRAKGSLNAALCRALVEDDWESVMLTLVDSLRDDPSNWQRLRIFQRNIPKAFSESETRALEAYFGALVQHLAPDLKNTTKPSLQPTPSKYDR